MGLAVRVASPVSKVLARLHQWYATAWVLSRPRLVDLDETCVGRLRYALMMAGRTHPVQTLRLFGRVLQRNSNASPELLIELATMATFIRESAQATHLLQTAAEQAAPGGHTADAAQRLLHVNTAIGDGSLQASLHAAVEGLTLPPAIALTLVPVSGKYLDLWHLWLGQVRKHVGRQVVAMAMDDNALAALAPEPDVAVIDVRQFFSWNHAGRLHSHTRGVLWYLRVLLLRDLVQRGHPVLVLDLDAIPVGDVQAMLSNLPESDVIAQKDHSIPMDVDRQLGFVLCCGFMLWRPTKAARTLLDRFALETAVERDDQLALNHLLLLLGVQDQRERAGSLSFKAAGTHFVCPDPTLVSRSLDSGSVVRHFHQTGKSVPEIRDALGL